MSRGKLHHLEFYVNDLKSSLEFWDWFLGSMDYKVIAEFDDGRSYSLGETYLVFVQVQKDYLEVQNNRQAAGLNHLAFHMDTEDDLKDYHSQVQEHGAKVLKLNDFHLCFEAPDGIVVELFIP